MASLTSNQTTKSKADHHFFFFFDFTASRLNKIKEAKISLGTGIFFTKERRGGSTVPY